VLFHDLGKAKTYALRGGKMTFYNHQIVGADMADEVGKRLKFSAHDTARICWLVRHHMVPNDFIQMKLSTRRKWGLNPYFSDLLKVYLADAKASLPPSGKPDLSPSGWREGVQILKELEGKPVLHAPIVSGTTVMKILNIKSGPLVGKILKVVEEKKLENHIKSKPEAVNFLKANIKYLRNL